MKQGIKLFESEKVCAVWNEQEEDWCFFVVDVAECKHFKWREKVLHFFRSLPFVRHTPCT